MAKPSKKYFFDGWSNSFGRFCVKQSCSITFKTACFWGYRGVKNWLFWGFLEVLERSSRNFILPKTFGKLQKVEFKARRTILASEHQKLAVVGLHSDLKLEKKRRCNTKFLIFEISIRFDRLSKSQKISQLMISTNFS